MSSPKILYPQHGGKTALAPWVLEHFPPHQVYVEPFFGSGAVLLQKPRSDVEIANDLDARIVNVYRTAIEQPDLLAAALRVCPYHQGLEWDLGAEGVAAAVAAVAEAKQKYPGCRSSSTWIKGLGPGRGAQPHQPNQWSSWWRRVAPLVARISGVCFYNADACDVIDAHGSRDGALVYADPPYVGHEDEYTESVDYERLVASLVAASGAVVVSEYEAAIPLYPADWAVKIRVAVKRKVVAGACGTKREVLILNPQAVERLESRQLEMFDGAS